MKQITEDVGTINELQPLLNKVSTGREDRAHYLTSDASEKATGMRGPMKT
jgi:hypothetical protein